MAEQPARNPIAPLLESLGTDHLDPGYAEAAARRRAVPGRPEPSRARTRRRVALVAGCLVAGLIMGIAAWRTDSNQTRAENTRAALLADIAAAQDRQSQLALSATQLAEQLRASQSAAGAAGPVAEVTALENQGQLTPVTGPGLKINQDQPAAGQGQDRSVILDRDLQLLVNDLWAAGAEAVAIGGVRLNTRSAIRQAGGAILVDNRPVFWPLSVEAIGDPSAMQVKFISSPSYGRFSSFAQLYGIEFERSAEESISLPGGTAPDLLHAQPATTSGAQPTG
jgi:uncharacterized protein YlxW (UPF0749 family)